MCGGLFSVIPEMGLGISQPGAPHSARPFRVSPLGSEVLLSAQGEAGDKGQDGWTGPSSPSPT